MPTKKTIIFNQNIVIPESQTDDSDDLDELNSLMFNIDVPKDNNKLVI